MKSIILGLPSATVGGCVSVSVDDPRACDSTSLSFPGAPLFYTTLPPVTQSFTIDLADAKDFLTKVILVDGQLVRHDGGDLGIIDEIMITVTAPNGGDDLVLWDSKQNAGTVVPIKASDANLVDYIDGNSKFTVNVTLSTQHPPASDWQLDVSLCVSGEADKTYSL